MLIHNEVFRETCWFYVFCAGSSSIKFWSLLGWCPKSFKWYQSHAPNLVVCVGNVRRCRSPNGAKAQWACPPHWQNGEKGAIGPCEANVGLSRNLTVVLLSTGRTHVTRSVMRCRGVTDCSLLRWCPKSSH